MRPPSVLPASEDKQRFVQEMFDRIAPRYALVNTVMTFGLDRRWRRRAVASLALAPGSLVLDLACGPGELCRVLEGRGHRSVGLDLSWGMLAAGTHSRSVQGDVGYLPFPRASVDGITCGFGLRNFDDAAGALLEMGRVLRPGGRLALLEVAEPVNRLVAAGHRAYFRRVVPLIGTMLSDRAAYRYLPASLQYLPSAGELHDALATAGFSGIARQPLGGGATQLVSATRS